MDIRGEKQINVRGPSFSIFGRIFNLFDSRFYNGFVFTDTGSPFYTRSPQVQEAVLEDPTRYYGPRRIELGVRLSGGL